MWMGLTLAVAPLEAQRAPQNPAGGQPAAGQAAAGQPDLRSAAVMDRLRPTYVLRAGDQILIRAFEMEEISERPFRVDGDGFVNLPVLGKVQAGSLTVEKFEATLIEALRRYVRVPQVTVTVVQFTSEPVFFVGAFKAPGIYPLEGKRTLVEMMSAIGGLQPNASRRIKITRRKESGELPLTNAITSTDGSVSSVEINMASLRENVNPAEDIVLSAFDVISVERAEMVYVNGEVARVGAFELEERDSISVVQALTLAGGMTPLARPKDARILRPISNSSRRAEIPLDLTRILAGKDTDRPLLPNDVLFVPKGSSAKQNLGRAALIIIPTAVSIASIVISTSRY